jgi:AcrR family transcriptional regulator
MNNEIKAIARQHLAADGANLSLRGVARDMGIVPSALYRYFPSRDALLTALIIDAYDALGTEAARAEAAVPRDELRGRWLAICRAVRLWALEHPAEYGLLYGNPVPGYAAPPETTPLAARVILLLADVVAESSGPLEPAPALMPDAVGEDLRRMMAENPRPDEFPEELLDRVLTAWIQLFGLVCFEVFGRLDDMVQARAEYFDHHMGLMADLSGVPR